LGTEPAFRFLIITENYFSKLSFIMKFSIKICINKIPENPYRTTESMEHSMEVSDGGYSLYIKNCP
jgi:hypothetical protein